MKRVYHKQQVKLLDIKDTTNHQYRPVSSRDQTEAIMSHNLSELAGLREQILGQFAHLSSRATLTFIRKLPRDRPYQR
jgi:predicted transcriptional regulator